MNRWLKRLFYLLLLLLWLMVMLFPATAFVLARKGELHLGESVRIFMVQADDANGVAIEHSRQVGNSQCRRTSLTYLLWEGEGENVVYCQCVDNAGNLASNSCP